MVFLCQEQHRSHGLNIRNCCESYRILPNSPIHLTWNYWTIATVVQSVTWRFPPTMNLDVAQVLDKPKAQHCRSTFRQLCLLIELWIGQRIQGDELPLRRLCQSPETRIGDTIRGLLQFGGLPDHRRWATAPSASDRPDALTKLDESLRLLHRHHPVPFMRFMIAKRELRWVPMAGFSGTSDSGGWTKPSRILAKSGSPS